MITYTQKQRKEITSAWWAICEAMETLCIDGALHWQHFLQLERQYVPKGTTLLQCRASTLKAFLEGAKDYNVPAKKIGCLRIGYLGALTSGAWFAAAFPEPMALMVPMLELAAAANKEAQKTIFDNLKPEV